jgi:type IV pilus assembly protein PilM
MTTLKERYKNLLERMEMNALEWVGLDIGSSSVKMVRGTWRGKRFVAAGAALFEISGSSAADQQKPEEIILAIRHCLQKAELKNPYTVCAHSGPEVLTRHFRFPPIPEEALEQAIGLEAQQMSPFEAGQGIVAYQTIESSGGRADDARQGVLVVAMREAVEQKTEWVKAAGGKVMLMDVDGLAAMNCLCHCLSESLSGSVALVHVGNRFTTVTILGENGIPFIRDLTYAGKNILTSLHQQTGSADLEIRTALFGQDHIGRQVPTALLGALKNAATRSIADINDTLRYYLTQNPGSDLKRIYLTGGWALSRPFVELITQALPMQVEVFNPFLTLAIQAPPAQEALMKLSGPALTVAAGLAMRTLS